MSLRSRFWALGMVLGLVTAMTLPETLFPGVRPLALGVVFISLGICGELVHGVRLRRRINPTTLGDPLPADGEVEILKVSGVRSVANPEDDRFRRFEAWEPGVVWRPHERAGVPADSEGRECPAFLGRVALVSLYLGADGRGWTDAEVADSIAAMLRAGRWLEKEAQAWDAALNVVLPDTYLVAEGASEEEVLIGYQNEGDDVGPMEMDADRKALRAVTRAAGVLGFHDAEEMFREVGRRLGVDQAAWVVHVRRRGRSHALPRESTREHGLSALGVAFCHAREASFPEPLAGPGRTDPVTVVHELLHLFGATDKYNRSIRSYPPKAVTEREVMRLTETRLPRLRIDRETAREIGWTGERRVEKPKAVTGREDP